MIVGSGAYVDGRRIEEFDPTNGNGFEVLARAGADEGFVWVGLSEPSDSELTRAAEAFGIHPLAVEDAQLTHERPKIDVYGDTLTIVVRPARYLDAEERIHISQITMMASPRHVLVVRHGDALTLGNLRSRMEADPAWLTQGPGAVIHAIVDEVVEAYEPVMQGIAEDIDQVQEVVFSPDRESPTQRIYELFREVLELRRAVVPLADAVDRLRTLHHPVLNDELRRYFADTNDDLRHVVDQVGNDRELLDGALEANLTQVSVRQNEDMRKMSAWVAILAVPTMVAGIYGMNFDHMPELDTRYGYYVVMGVVALICVALHRVFKRSGWL